MDLNFGKNAWCSCLMCLLYLLHCYFPLGASFFLEIFGYFSLTWFDICITVCSIFFVVKSLFAITSDGRCRYGVSLCTTILSALRKTISNCFNFLNNHLCMPLLIPLWFWYYQQPQDTTIILVPCISDLLDPNIQHPLHRTNQIYLFI